MATWAVGDVQGCGAELDRLLEVIDFTPARDRLWFVGDLVNRGPRSLEVLRTVERLGDAAVVVLGNHDLHLLALARGGARLRPADHELRPVLEAPDRERLLDWLQARAVLHHDAALGRTMVHAGLPPQWDLETAQSCAAEVSKVLRGKEYEAFLGEMYGNHPTHWSESLKGWDRLRFITNCLTRLRYCDVNGHLGLEHKGPPGSQPKHLRPWFEWPDRKSRGMRILFGHWSTLGAYDADGVHALDTGCLWGGSLTALRIDTDPPQRIEQDCAAALPPGTD